MNYCAAWAKCTESPYLPHLQRARGRTHPRRQNRRTEHHLRRQYATTTPDRLRHGLLQRPNGVHPPLRSAADRTALCAAVLDGTIDAIVSDRTAVNADAKHLPVGQTQAGAVGCNGYSTACCIWPKENDADAAHALRAVVAEPYAVLGLNAPEWVNGAAANFVIFDDSTHQTINESYIQGRHLNTPWLGYELSGTITQVIHHGRGMKTHCPNKSPRMYMGGALFISHVQTQIKTRTTPMFLRVLSIT